MFKIRKRTMHNKLCGLSGRPDRHFRTRKPGRALSRNGVWLDFGVWCPRNNTAPSQPTVGGSFRGWCGAMFMLGSVVTPPNDGGVTRGFFNDKFGFVGMFVPFRCLSFSLCLWQYTAPLVGATIFAMRKGVVARGRN